MSEGCVYLAWSETGHYKIGVSKHPGKRVKHFDTIMPVNVQIIHSFPTDNCAGAESFLHGFLEQFHHKGEWFNLSREYVLLIKTTRSYFNGVWDHDMELVHLLVESAKIQQRIIEYVEKNYL